MLLLVRRTMNAPGLCFFAAASLALAWASPVRADEPSARQVAPPAAAANAWVHLEASPDVVLESIVAREAPLCNAPCDVEVPLDGYYRVTGPSILPSSGFRLKALPGERVILTVDGASKAVHAGGTNTMVAGGVVAAVGAAVILYLGAGVLVCAGSGGQACPLPSNVSVFAGLGIGGLGALGAGGVVALTGYAVKAHGSTAVDQTAAAVESRAPRVAKDDRWLRTPTWLEHPESRGALPAPVGVPILSRSF
jgi:hypothetical protein